MQRELRHVLFLLVWVFLLCVVSLNLNFQTLVTPQYGYGGDDMVACSFANTIRQGHLFENSRISKPFSFNSAEAPWEKLFYLVAVIIPDMFHLSDLGVLNFYYVLTYFLCALSAYVVLRKYRISTIFSILSAIAYAFMPYHFHRGIAHLALSSYYMVPLTFLVFSWLYEAKVFTFKYLFYALLCSFFLAAQTAYYFFFYALIIVALLLRSIYLKEKKSMLGISIVLFLSVLVFSFIYIFPAFFYQSEHGVNSSLISRNIIGARVYALRLIALLRPSSGIFSQILSPYLGNFYAMLGAHNEADVGYIGLLGIGGMFLCD